MTKTIFENFNNPLTDKSPDSIDKNEQKKSIDLQPNCPKDNNSNKDKQVTGDLCIKGKSQSPIDIKSNSVVKCSTTCDLSFFL